MLSELAHVAAALPPVADAFVKLTLFLAAARLLGPLLGRTNPRWQVFYWRAVAATTVVLSAVVLLGPTVSLPILEAESEQPSVIASSQPVSVSETSATETPLAQPAHGGSFASSASEIEDETVPAFMPVRAAAESTDWRGIEIVGVVWFLSVLALLAGVLVKDWRMGRIVRRAKAAPAGATECLLRVAGDLGYQRSVRLRVSTQVDSPRVTGLFRPVLVLPETVDLSCEEDLRGIFAHEVSHLVSGDLFWARVIQLLSIGLWFHPLMWRIGRRHLDACEQVSDAAAAEYLGDSEAYAGILARVALHAIGSRALAGIAMARSPSIRRRLLLLEKAICAGPLPRRRLMAVSTVVLVLVGVGGTMRLVAARGPGREARVAESGAGTISAHGVVVDDRGQAVAGATVYLREWSNLRANEKLGVARVQDVLASVETDAEGRFRFVDVPRRPFRIRWSFETPWDVVCCQKGFAIAWRHLPSEGSDDSLQLKLVPEVPIHGRVLDESGAPVADAKMEVREITSLWGNEFLGSPSYLDLADSELAPKAVTDSEGNAVLHGLPPDRRTRLLVTRDGLANRSIYVATTDRPQPSVTREPSVPGGEIRREEVFSRQFSIDMKPAGPTVRGRVTLADTGEPCADAQVELVSNLHHLWTRTDEKGRYVIRDAFVPVDSLTVQPAAGSEYLGRRRQIDLKAGDSEKAVDFVLPRGRVVRGSVTVEVTGKSVPGARLFCGDKLSERNREVVTRWARTDERGHFEMTVPEGVSKLRLGGTADGYLSLGGGGELLDSRYSRDIEAVPGKPIEAIHFVIPRGKVVRGIVRDGEGRPLAGAAIRTFQRGSAKQGTVTDSEGRFELDGFKTLELLELFAAHRESGLAGREMLDANASDERGFVQFTLGPTAAFTGTVLVEGKPQPDISVHLHHRAQWGGHQVGHTRTDREGRYRFDLVLPGMNYFVTTVSEDFTDGVISLLEAEPGKTLELEPMKLLARTASVSGIIVDPKGNPVAGVTVEAKLREGGSLSRAFTMAPTGKDGRFSIVGLPERPLTLTACLEPEDASGDQSVRSYGIKNVEPNETDVRIILDP